MGLFLKTLEIFSVPRSVFQIPFLCNFFQRFSFQKLLKLEILAMGIVPVK